MEASSCPERLENPLAAVRKYLTGQIRLDPSGFSTGAMPWSGTFHKPCSSPSAVERAPRPVLFRRGYNNGRAASATLPAKIQPWREFPDTLVAESNGCP